MNKQTISRENLLQIHNVACTSWQIKLENYASRNPFQIDIELSQNEIDEMFNASDDKQKLILNKFFKRPKSIIDKIKNFYDACEHLSINSKSVYSSDDTKDEIGYKKLKVIIRALNEGWYPNWENENEYKYFNYFKMKGGFSFWRAATNCNTLTDVPSALCLKNADLAKHCADIAKKEYEDYYS
jgi:hypothetical protein